MSAIDKVAAVKAVINESNADSALIGTYLSIAESMIAQRRYPFGVPEDWAIPTSYDFLHVTLASRLYIRRGAEGELIHNENGVNRTYASASDEDLLSQITPIARV